MSMTGCAVSQGVYNNMVTYEPEMYNGRIDANVRMDVKHSLDSATYSMWKSWGNPDSNIDNWKNAVAEMILKDFRASGIFYRVLAPTDYSPYDMEIRLETQDIKEGSEYFISADMRVYDAATRAEISSHSIKRSVEMKDYKPMLKRLTGELKGLLMSDYELDIYTEAINRGRERQQQQLASGQPPGRQNASINASARTNSFFGAALPAPVAASQPLTMPLPLALASVEDIEADNQAFMDAEGTDTVDGWSAYLKTNPTNQHREEALEALSFLLVEAGDTARIAGMVEDHPDLIDLLPLKFSLAFIGPPELPVSKVVEYKEQGIGDELMAAKIMSTEAPYKKFDIDEMLALKEMGLTEPIIKAMMDVTTQAEQGEAMRKLEADNLRQQAELERIRNERNVRRISQQVQQPTPAAAPQPEEPGVGENVANCVAQATAIEVCNEAPGGFLGQSICKAAAKASFPCK